LKDEVSIAVAPEIVLLESVWVSVVPTRRPDVGKVSAVPFIWNGPVKFDVPEYVPVPVTVGPEMVGAVRVLFVSVWISVVPAMIPEPGNVCATPPTVNIPVNVGPDIAGDVNVLFVRVSVVFLPTKVSVADGSVSVPEATEFDCKTV
jgi:hypothetical protein